MPDRPPMPAPPEGCVYGPWLGKYDRWHAVIEFGATFSDGRAYKTVGLYGAEWDDEAVIGPSERELLRLSKDNEAKAAFIRKVSAVENSLEMEAVVEEAKSLLGEAIVSHEGLKDEER